MNDLVVLDNDKVVDAIFRDPNRHYTGKSSSPMALTPAEAQEGRDQAGGAAEGRPTRRAREGGGRAAPPAAPAPPPLPAADSTTPKTDSTAKPPAA